jgi:predicted HTH transcriptional regulator
LNSNGGHIIFGIVDDDLVILGCRMTSKDIDKFNLFADHLYNRIVHTDGTIMGSNVITTRIERITKNRYVCIIGFHPEKDKSYQLTDGSFYKRINASNKKYTSAKLFHQNEVNIMIAKVENEKTKEIEKIEKRRRLEMIDYLNGLEKERDKIEKNIIIQVNNILYNYYHHKNTVSHKFQWNIPIMIFITLSIIIIKLQS